MPADRADGHEALAPSPLSGGKPSSCLCADLRLPESVGTLMGEPKLFLTRLPLVPKPKHNQLRGHYSQTPETSRKMWRCQSAWGNPLLHGRL